jgi:hypothetical protein
MELIAFHKCIPRWYASKAANSSEILGELPYSVECQLVQLRLEFQ